MLNSVSSASMSESMTVSIHMIALVARYYKSFPRWLMNIPQDHTDSRILYRREHRSLDSLIGCLFNTFSQLSQQLNPFLFVDVGLSFSSQRLPWWIRPLSKGCPRGVLSPLLSPTSGPPRNLPLNRLCSCITELLKPPQSPRLRTWRRPIIDSPCRPFHKLPANKSQQSYQPQTHPSDQPHSRQKHHFRRPPLPDLLELLG